MISTCISIIQIYISIFDFCNVNHMKYLVLYIN